MCELLYVTDGHLSNMHKYGKSVKAIVTIAVFYLKAQPFH